MPQDKQPKLRAELSPAQVEAKRQERIEYARQRNKTPEHREQQRLRAQEQLGRSPRVRGALRRRLGLRDPSSVLRPPRSEPEKQCLPRTVHVPTVPINRIGLRVVVGPPDSFQDILGSISTPWRCRRVLRGDAGSRRPPRFSLRHEQLKNDLIPPKEDFHGYLPVLQPERRLPPEAARPVP